MRHTVRIVAALAGVVFMGRPTKPVAVLLACLVAVWSLGSAFAGPPAHHAAGLGAESCHAATPAAPAEDSAQAEGEEVPCADVPGACSADSCASAAPCHGDAGSALGAGEAAWAAPASGAPGSETVPAMGATSPADGKPPKNLS
jgi:hypothetical protein